MDFPYGAIVETPADFVPPELWPEYAYRLSVHPWCRIEAIDGGTPGMRWSLWPLCFEEYTGDSEPDTAKASTGGLAYNRLATWKRLHRMDTPKGWFAMTKKPQRIDGFKRLSGDVTEGWNKNARRELRIWQESFLNVTHSIEEIGFDEYADAYSKSLVAQFKKGGLVRLHTLKRKLTEPATAKATALWGVRDLRTKEVVAGTAVIYSPTASNSTHFAPFMRAEARSVFASTALVHHWFTEAKGRGLRYAMTMNFWYPGKPRSWKGFSEFKSHFGFSYVAYPPELFRFVRGKFW